MSGAVSPAMTSADVAIVGLGVIGGSAALRLRDRGTRVRAFAASAADAALASAAGIEVARSLEDAVRDVGLVLVAVPLDAMPMALRAVVAAAAPATSIFHAASLQRRAALDTMPEIESRVVGTHPMAGSQGTGFAAASPQLFHGATVYVEQRATPRQREDAELFWSMAGAARVEYSDAESHDRAMAWISHLPQLAATALAVTMAEHAPLSSSWPPGPGARDTTRLALSSLEMWRPILQRAPESSLEALRAIEDAVSSLRRALEQRDWSQIDETWTRARDWRSAFERKAE
jgi:prephenate dehydrogenase